MAKPQRITLNDIAREVDMSRATVSAVLNENASCFASQKTRKLIRETARRMGYVPNLLARSMRVGRSYTVGMLSDGLQLEIHHKVMVTLANLLHGSQYALNVSYSRGETELTRKMAQDMVARGFDALVVHGDGALMDAEFYRSLGIPVVLLPYVHPIDADYAHAIYVDHAAGTREAYEALYALGHRRIHMLCHGNPEFRPDSRLVAFQQAVREFCCGDPEDSTLLLGEPQSFRQDQLLIEKYLAAHPDATALMVMSDAIAMRLTHIIREMGIRIPEDLSLVGFDGLEAGEYSFPPLSTIRQDFDAIAHAAYSLLMNLLEGTEHPVPEVIPTGYVARRSCAPVRTYKILNLK